MNQIKNKTKTEKIIKIIKNDPVSKQYFYTKSEVDKSWFDALRSEKVFDLKKISKVNEIGDRVEYSRWIEGDYLIKIASKIPFKVLTLLNSFTTANVENPIIKEKLLEIMILLVQNIPEIKTKDLISRIAKEKWFEFKYQNLMVYKLEDLILALCKKKHIDSLILVLPSILKLKNPPEGYKYKLDPIPLFDNYIYQQILDHITELQIKDRKKCEKLISIFLNLLKDHIEIENEIRTYVEREDDTSIVWKPDLAVTDIKTHRDLDESLLDTARDLLLKNLDFVDIPFVKEVITKYKYSVFKRLALYIMTQKELDTVEIFKLLNNWIKNNLLKTELRQVLKQYFPKFNETQRQILLKNIVTLYNLDEEIGKRRYLINEKYVQDEKDLRKQVKQYIMRNITHYIQPISKYLTNDEKEKFKVFLHKKDDYKPPYLSLGGEFKSGPNSRMTIEEMKDLNIRELVKKFEEDAVWFTKNICNKEMFSPCGMARIWILDIQGRPEEYLANLRYFKPAKLLPPVYIYYLFNGFTESIKEKKIDLSRLMNFLDKLLKQYKSGSLPEFPVKDNFEVGSWDEVLIAILRFLDDALRVKGVIKKGFEKIILKFIYFCLNNKEVDEIKEEEEKYSSKDYYTHSINSLYGLALHCSMRYATWRVIEGIAKQSLTTEIKRLIKKELNKGIKTTFSVYGYYFPTIFYYDKKFALKIKTILFDNKDAELKYSAFGSFLFNNVYKEIIDSLSDSYKNLIQDINKIPKSEQGPDIKEKLIEHVMISYIHDLPKTTELKLELFKQKQEYKEYAIEFVGRAYISAEKKSFNMKIKDRIKNLWEESVKDKNLSYGKEFGWWLNSQFFKNDSWLFSIFIKTLKKTNGIIDPDFKVLKELSDLSKKYPRECLQALLIMVKGKDVEKSYYFRDKEVLEIIENGESGKQPELDKITDEIRNELVKYGFTQYKK